MEEKPEGILPFPHIDLNCFGFNSLLQFYLNLSFYIPSIS